jgi:cytochrome c551/c552
MRESAESTVLGAAVKALRKLLVRYANEMGAQVQLLVAVTVAIAIAGVDGALPCQADLAQSDSKPLSGREQCNEVT